MGTIKLRMWGIYCGVWVADPTTSQPVPYTYGEACQTIESWGAGWWVSLLHPRHWSIRWVR